MQSEFNVEGNCNTGCQLQVFKKTYDARCLVIYPEVNLTDYKRELDEIFCI